MFHSLKALQNMGNKSSYTCMPITYIILNISLLLLTPHSSESRPSLLNKIHKKATEHTKERVLQVHYLSTYTLTTFSLLLYYLTPYSSYQVYSFLRTKQASSQVIKENHVIITSYPPVPLLESLSKHG